MVILDDLTRQQRTNFFVAAAGAGRLREVEARLDNHQYCDAVHDKMQYTALHAAADFGHVDVVKVSGVEWSGVEWSGVLVIASPLEQQHTNQNPRCSSTRSCS